MSHESWVMKETLMTHDSEPQASVMTHDLHQAAHNVEPCTMPPYFSLLA